MALTTTPEIPNFNNDCPDFKLFGVDEKWHTLSEYKNNEPLLVMFICNHCPYVKAIEDRLIKLGEDLKLENINVIAICSNDPQRYEEDKFENLQKRWKEKNYSFIYLHDVDQSVAKAFDAVCTPDFFLYDRNLKLKYRGRLDDNWKEPSLVTHRELYHAALDLKNKGEVSFKQIPSMGCSIKWLQPKEI